MFELEVQYKSIIGNYNNTEIIVGDLVGSEIVVGDLVGTTQNLTINPRLGTTIARKL